RLPDTGAGRRSHPPRHDRPHATSRRRAGLDQRRLQSRSRRMTTDGQQGHAGLGIQRVGAALLIWRGVRPGDGAVSLARGMAPEPGRTAVVVDAPAAGPDLWPAGGPWVAALPP